MKNFDARNTLKKHLHDNRSEFYVKAREIRYMYFWINIGFEEDGKGDDFKRPALVLKKIGNVFAVLPMTTGGKDTIFYHSLPDTYFKKPSRIILSQFRVVDKSRFIEKIGTVSVQDFLQIKEKLKALVL